MQTHIGGYASTPLTSTGLSPPITTQGNAAFFDGVDDGTALELQSHGLCDKVHYSKSYFEPDSIRIEPEKRISRGLFTSKDIANNNNRRVTIGDKDLVGPAMDSRYLHQIRGIATSHRSIRRRPTPCWRMASCCDRHMVIPLCSNMSMA